MVLVLLSTLVLLQLVRLLTPAPGIGLFEAKSLISGPRSQIFLLSGLLEESVAVYVARCHCRPGLRCFATLPLEFREAAALEGKEIEVWDFAGGAFSQRAWNVRCCRAWHCTRRGVNPSVLALAVDLGSPHGVARSLQSWLSVIASTVGGEGVRRILLVGTRWDALLALQLGEAHLEATEQQLRSVAATSGAELLYTAAASDADVAGVIGRLRSLLSEPAQRLGRPGTATGCRRLSGDPRWPDRDGCASTACYALLSPARTDVPVAAATTRRTRLDDEAPFRKGSSSGIWPPRTRAPISPTRSSRPVLRDAVHGKRGRPVAWLTRGSWRRISTRRCRTDHHAASIEHCAKRCAATWSRCQIPHTTKVEETTGLAILDCGVSNLYSDNMDSHQVPVLDQSYQASRVRPQATYRVL